MIVMDSHQSKMNVVSKGTLSMTTKHQVTVLHMANTAASGNAVQSMCKAYDYVAADVDTNDGLFPVVDASVASQFREHVRPALGVSANIVAVCDKRSDRQIQRADGSIRVSTWHHER